MLEHVLTKQKRSGAKSLSRLVAKPVLVVCLFVLIPVSSVQATLFNLTFQGDVGGDGARVGGVDAPLGSPFSLNIVVDDAGAATGTYAVQTVSYTTVVGNYNFIGPWSNAIQTDAVGSFTTLFLSFENNGSENIKFDAAGLTGMSGLGNDVTTWSGPSLIGDYAFNGVPNNPSTNNLGGVGFRSSSLPLSFSFTVVPEPSSITLAALGLLGMGWRRRKWLRSRLYLLDATQQVCVMKTSVLMLCSLAIMVISTRNAIAAQSDFSESNGLTGIVDFDTGNVNFGTATCTVANGCITSYSFSDGAVSETWSHTSPIIDTPLSLNMSGSTIIGTNTDWLQSPDTGSSRVLSQPAGLNGTLSSQHFDPGGLVLGAGDGTFSAVVPEPGSLALLGVGTVVLLGRPRSRKGLP